MLARERERFCDLKQRLPQIWEQLRSQPDYPHTSVIVPSLSVDQAELSKVVGASFYEERLLFSLIRLKNPKAKLVYVSSQPVHPEIVEYYLRLLDGVSFSQALRRLHMVCVYDASQRPLTEKILERPRVLARIREAIGDPTRSYLTTYNSTPLERQLAVELGIPLNGLDPELLGLGTKSGCRKIFARAGVDLPRGFEDLRDEKDIVAALVELGRQRPELEQAVVKLDEGFGGEGNGLFRYPARRRDPGAVADSLRALALTSPGISVDAFLGKMAAIGGIVEERIVGPQLRSPSVQMRILPGGEARLVSSHEQVLGGATGQSYLGCEFPARDNYRSLLQESARRVAEVLSAESVLGRFAVDFVVWEADGRWRTAAIEINLRMGGTTPPFHALEFLTGGSLDQESGRFYDNAGQEKFYCATDNLKSPDYRGLLPEDLFEIVARHRIAYSGDSGTGALFYMLGALSQYGKIGMTCIENSRDGAQALFERVVAVLDAESDGDQHGVPTPVMDRHVTME